MIIGPGMVVSLERVRPGRPLLSVSRSVPVGLARLGPIRLGDLPQDRVSLRPGHRRLSHPDGSHLGPGGGRWKVCRQACARAYPTHVAGRVRIERWSRFSFPLYVCGRA